MEKPFATKTQFLHLFLLVGYLLILNMLFLQFTVIMNLETMRMLISTLIGEKL